MSPPRCRNCGADDTVHFGSQARASARLPFEYFRCRTCLLTFVEPVTPDSIYNDAYYEGRGVDPYVNYRAEYEDYRRTDRIHEFKDLLRLVGQHWTSRPPQPRPAHLDWLDFGCGAGGLLKFLRDQHQVGSGRGAATVRITGSDLGSYAARLQRDDGFRILAPTELQSLPDHQFDVITAIEVLEHVAHPAPVIALLARLLKPGGLLLLTTGNFDCPVARWQGVDFRYCMPEIHVSLFQPRTLERLYRASGLIPVRMRYRGVITFKVLKSAGSPFRRRVFGAALALPGVRRAVDRLYGTSAMPCAIKPA